MAKPSPETIKELEELKGLMTSGADAVLHITAAQVKSLLEAYLEGEVEPRDAIIELLGYQSQVSMTGSLSAGFLQIVNNRIDGGPWETPKPKQAKEAVDRDPSNDKIATLNETVADSIKLIGKEHNIDVAEIMAKNMIRMLKARMDS